jgi:hypothetical protein
MFTRIPFIAGRLLPALLVLIPAAAAGRTVNLEIVPTVTGRVLRIEGAANLPDYSYVDWELRHTLRYELMKRVPFEYMTTEGRAMVRNGRFQAIVDLGRWPAGPVEVWVGFQPIAFGGPQPAMVTRVFGENGERLEGANVECIGQFRNMFRAATVTYVSLDGAPRQRTSSSAFARGRRRPLARP